MILLTRSVFSRFTSTFISNKMTADPNTSVKKEQAQKENKNIYMFRIIQ